ncbi:MAG: hypothetical protein V3R94_09575 [Acidobacteriota bacterium]
MTEEHLGFSDLDFLDIEPPAHADRCQECGERWSVFRFLGFQVRNAPEMDIPPFFSKRVSQLVRQTKVSFAIYFQQAVRQLIPVFMGLLLATGGLLYIAVDPGTSTEQYSELFFDQPFDEDLSMDYVVDSLGELPEEETGP